MEDTSKIDLEFDLTAELPTEKTKTGLGKIKMQQLPSYQDIK